MGMGNDNPFKMLTIAGFDPSGGAGIIADVKCAAEHGVNALGAVTALTIQSTRGLERFIPVPVADFREQLSVLLSDIVPDSVKIGMLPSGEHALAIASMLQEYCPEVPVVAVPVLAPTSGNPSNSDKAALLEAYAGSILQNAVLATPNIPECEDFLGKEISSLEDSLKAAVDFTGKFGSRATLLKGGHGKGNADTLIDIFYDSDSGHLAEIIVPKVDTCNLHGTGCILSSAIASHLASGETLEAAVMKSESFINKALTEGAVFKYGSGNGASLIL